LGWEPGRERRGEVGRERGLEEKETKQMQASPG
jgi:hypothetical protein